MKEKVLFIFWDGAFRILSTGPDGGECQSRAEAMQMLFEQVASQESTLGYLNQIYDNAQVELRPDNMQTVTVLGAYYIRDIYIQKKAPEAAEDVLTYAETGGKPIGMAYAPKSPQSGEPDFEEALAGLMAEMRRRGEVYRREDRRLFDD